MKRLFIVLLFPLALPVATHGDMTSTNYHIYADSIGAPGGQFSTSTVYKLTDTIGESAVGTSTASTYLVRGGFQASEQDETLSISLSSASLSLGTLSASAVSSASTVVTISANAITGFSVALTNISGTMPQAVSDGTVSAGAEEYGVSTSGVYGALSGDVAVANNLVIASSAGAVHSAPTTLTFEASQSSASTAGAYSQSVTLTASANF